MLFKDGKKTELTPSQKGELMDVIKKFPVSVVYVPEKVSIRKDGQGRPKKVFPPGVDVGLKNTVVDEKGTAHEYVWAENVRTVDRTNTYYPSSYRFTAMNLFQEKDIEFVWYLWYCVPCLRYGHNASDTGVHELMFNLPFASQQKEVDYNRKLAMVTNQVYGDEDQISTKKLREISKALFIRGVDDMERTELQFHLGEILKTGNSKYDRVKILDRFIDLNEDSELQKVSSLVQAGVEKGILKLNEETRYVILTVDDKIEKIGKKIPVNKDFKEETIKVLLTDTDNLTLLELALK